MSEHVPKPDGEVFYSFEKMGKRHEATTENTQVWQYVGRLAVYDFVRVDWELVWRNELHYNELLYLSLLNECEHHSRVRSVPPIVMDIFLKDHTRDLQDRDTPPNGWPEEYGPSSPQE